MFRLISIFEYTFTSRLRSWIRLRDLRLEVLEDNVTMEATWDINFTSNFEKDAKRLSKSGLDGWLTGLSFLKDGPRVDNKQLKALKGQSKAFRWRRGNLRVIFRVIGQSKSILLLAVGHRKDIYIKTPSGKQDIAGSFDELIIQNMRSPKPSNNGENEATAMQNAMKNAMKNAMQNTLIFDPVDGQGELEEIFVDEADLFLLDIPQEYYPLILDVKGLSSLEGKGIPSSVMRRLEDYLTAPSTDHIGKIYSLDQSDDVDVIANHTLDRFLVSLDPQQKSIVEKPFDGGPWLIRGGPGTGKTLINIARIKRIYQEGIGVDLLQNGPIKTGFVTFNNQLSKSAEAMFKSISINSSGDDIRFSTLDSLVAGLLGNVARESKIATEEEQAVALNSVMGSVNDERWDEKYISTIQQRRGSSFILEEFEQVILGNGLINEDDHLNFVRKGRKVALQSKERGLIHKLYRLWSEEMERRGLSTYAGRRHTLEQMISHGKLDISRDRYDYLFIDELQDLSVTAIRLLSHLVKYPKNLTFTADSAQSIYLKSPSWSNISDDIRFHAGNSFILRKSYRITTEIDRAIRPLRLNAGDTEKDNDGIEKTIFSGKKPGWLNASLENHPSIAAELAQSLIEKDINPGQIAIITPDKKTKDLVQQALSRYGIPTDVYQTNKGLDITSKAVHLLYAHVVKGLEFPFVIVTGIVEGKYPPYPAVKSAKDTDQLEEIMDKARRLLYVALSRAARGLWMITDKLMPSPLLSYLNQEDWIYEEKRVNSILKNHHEITSYVAGIQYACGEIILSQCFQLDDILTANREKDNTHDSNAIFLTHNKNKVGYILKDLAASVANVMDQGMNVSVRIIGINDSSLYDGLRISISMPFQEKGGHIIRGKASEPSSIQRFKDKYKPYH